FDKEATKDKTFYFAVTNVSAEDSTSGSYKADILIKVDPTKYTSSGGTISNNSAQHNDKIMADLYSMDTSKDAFYIEAGTQLTNAYNELLGKGAVIDDAEDISKKIEVTVAEDASHNKKVTYKFKYSAGGYNVEYPTNPALSTLKYAELENVYLFYLPSYGSLGDEITYNNTTGQKLTFVLVKRQITEADNIQVPDPTPPHNMPYKVDDPSLLNTKELGYNCKVNITPTDKTTLRTNVKTNLSTLINNPGAILTDTLAFVNLPSGITNESVAGVKEEDRIFDVTIDIYEPGTIEAAVGPGGTGQLPADKHLITVTGNMN
ncbi:MAG: hypothetical protein IK123_08460, partial [Lachnospiraceae bacterium]|nr:hypothetical protein [Lachnospiraceae bacterium]